MTTQPPPAYCADCQHPYADTLTACPDCAQPRPGERPRPEHDEYGQPPAPPLPEHGSWMQTFSGVAFDLAAPTPQHVRLMDITVHLSQINRWTGGTSMPVSVLEHSLAVREIVRDAGGGLDVQLQALLHDAPEAYLGDVSRPLKALLPEYRALEARVWGVICQRYLMGTTLDPLVEWADQEALAHEAALFLPRGPLGWTPQAITTETPTPYVCAVSYGHRLGMEAFYDTARELLFDLGRELL